MNSGFIFLFSLAKVIFFKDNFFISLAIENVAGPVGVENAGLLYEHIVKHIIFLSVLAKFGNGGVGEGLVVGDMVSLVVILIVAADAAAPHFLELAKSFQIAHNGIVALVVEVFKGGLGIVGAELDGNALAHEALDKRLNAVGGVICEKDAVDAGGNLDFVKDAVAALFNIGFQMAGNVYAGEFADVAVEEVHNLILAILVHNGQGGVYENSVACGNGIQHGLEAFQICKRLAAGEHEVTLGGNRVDILNALNYLLGAEAFVILIFSFVDAEGAVVAAIIGHKNCNSCAALSGFVKLAHLISLQCSLWSNIITLTLCG